MRWIRVIACIACLLVGAIVGLGWNIRREMVAPPPPQYEWLPKAAFDRSEWLGLHLDNDRKIQARGAMAEAVLARVKPGMSLYSLLDELGCPDRIDLLRDTGPETTFESNGTMIARYYAGWIPSGFDDWYPAEVSFVFSADGKLLRADNAAS